MDFKALAKMMKVKLDDKRPFIKVECLDSIGVEAFKFKPHVIIGTRLYDRLSSKERLAVIAHEFAHIKMRHILVEAVSILALGIMVFHTVPSASLVSGIMVMTAIFMAFWISSHLCEYWPDSVAIRHTQDKDSLISALKKLEPPEKWNVDYETHPSTSQRTARLSKM